MKRFIAGCLLVIAVHSYATPFATDATDLWLSPNEDGWGVTMYQQGDTLFVTFFIYGPNGPTWYSGSSVQFASSTGGTLSYSGPLYLTGGSPFTSPWNPAVRSLRQVGTVTVLLSTITTATITYTVDGASVTKPLTRYAFKENNLVGSYIGATIGTYSGCGGLGYTETPASFEIMQSGSQVTIRSQEATGTCTYVGTVAQAGRMSAMSGPLACSTGSSGTFQAFELHANVSGVTGRATANLGGGCTWSGRIGGLRRGS